MRVMQFDFLKSVFKKKRSENLGDAELQKHTGANTIAMIPQIAKIKKIRSSNDLPTSRQNGKILIIDNFEHANLDLYVREHHNAKVKCEITAKAGLRGNALKINYQLGLQPNELRCVDVARKFIMKEGIQDWSAYKYLNFTFKVQKATSLLRVCIVEEDGDWWNCINHELFDADFWYWVKIPLTEMFILKEFSIQGDGKQDFTKVAEIRFLFDSTNIGHNLTENTAYIDQVFLSK